MELDEPAINAAALPPAAADTAAAAADLLQISAAAAASAGQLGADLTACALLCTSLAHTMGCSYVFCMLL